MLVHAGKLNAKAAEALVKQAAERKVSFVSALIAAGSVSASDLAHTLSGALALPVLDLASVDAERLPRNVIDECARRGDAMVAALRSLLDQGSGMGVIPRCRSTHPPGRVVVFSNYASPAVRRHCTELGADAVFDKADSPRFIAWKQARSAWDFST